MPLNPGAKEFVPPPEILHLVRSSSVSPASSAGSSATPSPPLIYGAPLSSAISSTALTANEPAFCAPILARISQPAVSRFGLHQQQLYQFSACLSAFDGRGVGQGDTGVGLAPVEQNEHFEHRNWQVNFESGDSSCASAYNERFGAENIAAHHRQRECLRDPNFGRSQLWSNDSATHSQTGNVDVDSSNFDLPCFLHDMLLADSDDFRNYLTYRAEYLLSYCRSSPSRALECADKILEVALARINSDFKQCERILRLATEMTAMDLRFYCTLLHRLNQDLSACLQRLKVSGVGLPNWRPVEPAAPLCMVLARVLSALHVGTCMPLPKLPQFSVNACSVIFELLKKKSTVEVAVRSLEICYLNLRVMTPTAILEALNLALLKLPFFLSADMRRRLIDLQRLASERYQHSVLFPSVASMCSFHKSFAVPTAESIGNETERCVRFLEE